MNAFESLHLLVIVGVVAWPVTYYWLIKFGVTIL